MRAALSENRKPTPLTRYAARNAPVTMLAVSVLRSTPFAPRLKWTTNTTFRATCKTSFARLMAT